MDNLTPQLNAQQLKSNIDALQKGGMKTTDIQSYVNNYKSDGKGGYVLASAQPAEKQGVMSSIMGGFKAIGNALTSSEQGSGRDIGTAINENMPGVLEAQNKAVGASAQASHLNDLLIQKQNEMKAAGKDTSAIDRVIAENNAVLGEGGAANAASVMQNIPTNSQVAGDFGGVALDALSAGSYGKAAQGAKTGQLLTKGASVAAPILETAAKDALGQTLKTIGTKTAIRSGVGAATGYGYDISQNLQNGKEGTAAFAPGMGTALGAIIPAGIGGIEATAAITKDTAPRFINSLIKPNAASFSYGKDPGRTVSEMGITGNNLSDFTNNISKAKQDVGSQIGAIISNPANTGARISANDTIAKLDSAISDAAKGGKNNQGIVTALQNAKDALLYEHGVDANGNIVKAGTTPRDLSALNPQQAFDLKGKIASMTQFTGKPSDDKTVNSVLKQMYGDLKGKINGAVGTNNPEIIDLNQKYADLTSAELATKNRDAIVQRSNMVSMPIKMGTAAGVITAIASGGVGLPAILAAVGAGALDKAMGSTAVKSRVAAWLGSESPSVIQKVLQQNPDIKTVLYRALPKMAAQLGQPAK